jgi:UDPglucose 6-dehydrogenase
MKTIAVIGAGYVGLTTAACMADLGNSVCALDIDAARIAGLRKGKIPIFEPGLEETLVRNMRAGRLHFTTDYAEGLAGAAFAFIAVDTPMGRRGAADLSSVRQAAQGIARVLREPLTIVNKSTVPIGTGDIVSQLVRQHGDGKVPFAVVSNPEFLREGSALHDFMHPDRVVLGAHDRKAAEAVAELYAPLECPLLITDLYTAEMIKYASNAYLATRISFINEIARICERLDADVKVVAKGMGMDRRIGGAFLEAGLGYGGSCFPKDVRALARMAEQMGYHPELLDAVIEINQDQRRLVVEKLRDLLGTLRNQTIALLGLAFKPNTDDIRDAPALDLIAQLQQKGARLKVYDPAAMPRARAVLSAVTYCKDAYDAARGADALVVVTEWNEFQQLDLRRIKGLMRRPVVVDGRNLYNRDAMRTLGFVYRGIGR